MKRKVEAFDYAGLICKALSKGVLLTTRSGDRVNTMTIGWGKIGIEWGKPVFIAYVRESRYTKQLLEGSGEFTVNVPLTDDHREILGYCGTRSGRDTDKIRDKGLTIVDSDVVSAPGIVQFPLTLECRVIYRQEQDICQMPQDVIDRFYPPFGEKKAPDMHTAFYGEIVNAYLIEQD
ncbi:MAG: flavin reductase family protein [Eubacteriales bacterium]|nr:flavin reductase family protein [Eubacteriales bacterium]